MTLVIISFIIYLFALAITTYISIRQETPSAFINANRKVNVFSTMAALASSFRDGAGIAAWVTLSVFFGFGALWLTIGLGAGLALFAWFAPKIRELASNENFLTVGDLLSLRIGKKTAWVSSIIIVCTSLLYAAAQIYFSGQILSKALDIPFTLGIFIPVIVVSTYVVIGGYSVVTKTDVLQWLIIMLIPLLPFLANGPRAFSDIVLDFNTFTNIGFINGFGFAGISFLVVISGGDVWQRLFATSSPSTARIAFLLTIPVYFIISVGLVIFGLFVKQIAPTGVDPSTSFFEIFSSASVSGAALLGIFIAASAMSTLDTQIFLFSSTIAKDFLQEGYPGYMFAKKSSVRLISSLKRVPVLKTKQSSLHPNTLTDENTDVTSEPQKTSESDESSIRVFSRFLVIITMILLGVLATTIGNIVEFLFGAVTLQTILTPILLIAVTNIHKQPKTADSLFAFCLIASTVLYCIMFFAGYYESIIFTLIPALFSCTLCIIAYIWSKSSLFARF